MSQPDKTSSTPKKTSTAKNKSSTPQKRAATSTMDFYALLQAVKDVDFKADKDEDVDFCIICLTLLPNKLTAQNSIKCNECRRPVHLKCANMRRSFFTCKHCDSELDDEMNEDDEIFD